MREIKLIILAAIFAIIASIGILNVKPANASPAAYNMAKKYIGLHERKNTRALRNSLGVNPRNLPWCGAFVRLVHKRIGKPIPKGYLASVNWRNVGRSVSLRNARRGDVVILRTKVGNHVGFYAGRNKNGSVRILGGNQSNMVKVSNFLASSIRSIRRM